ncbi:MAG: response regulator, partial [Bryobacteraceae bacterium]
MTHSAHRHWQLLAQQLGLWGLELARTRLRKLLAGYGDVIVVGEAGDGEEAIQQVAELRPDAVFLDIKMPGADGLEVVRSLGSRRPKIVFCTAFDEYAVEAFELHAVDYLLKPVTR